MPVVRIVPVVSSFVPGLVVPMPTLPDEYMLLAVRLVKLPLGLVTDVAAATVLALTNPLAEMLLAVKFVML